MVCKRILRHLEMAAQDWIASGKLAADDLLDFKKMQQIEVVRLQDWWPWLSLQSYDHPDFRERKVCRLYYRNKPN
jgi:hypothetical protein